jgi:sirohydrochlorin ferrochelatase
MLGLLLVDHGSRRAEANAQFEDMANRLAARCPDALVVCCHMEVSPPYIADGFADLVKQGATTIRVLPYFLGDGRHSREDIPMMCAEAAANYPGLRWSLAAVLGPDDLLVDLLLRRAEAAALR